MNLSVKQLAVEYRAGNKAAFNQIYEQLTEVRVNLLATLRSKLPHSISQHELLALYDSSLLTAIESYNFSGSESFADYLSYTIESKSNELLYHHSINRITAEVERSLPNKRTQQLFKVLLNMVKLESMTWQGCNALLSDDVLETVENYTSDQLLSEYLIRELSV